MPTGGATTEKSPWQPWEPLGRLEAQREARDATAVRGMDPEGPLI